MNVCLVMIVKNEAHCLERCLRSVLPFISAAVICDTGSTDGTQDVVRKVFEGTDINWGLFEDEWVHFAHNRTLAIQRAKGLADYHLMMDADHEWKGKFPTELGADCYLVPHHYDFLRYDIPILMKDGHDWEYVCPVHETVRAFTAKSSVRLPKSGYVQVYAEGARSKDPDKYKKDAAVLQKHVDEHPDDARATYYLAQSYWNAGMIKEAREWYAKRAQMVDGWWEERWHAMFRLAQTAQALDLDFAIVMTEYLSAYQANPLRAEPLVTLARFARLREPPFHAITLMAARQAMAIPKPQAGLFLEPPAYDWVAADEFAVSSFYAGSPQEGLKTCQQLLRNPLLPEQERARIEKNIAFFRGKASKAA